MVGLRVVVGIAVLVALGATARAGSWGFDWTCAGACAPDTLDVRGHEGPYSDEGSCDAARRQKALEINSSGSAGSATSCSEGSASGGGGGAGAAVGSAAHVGRIFLGATYSNGYHATYANGAKVDGGNRFGGELDMMFGLDRLGLALAVGLDGGGGTTGDPATPPETMYTFDLGLGLTSSPFAFVGRGGKAVRPELGAYLWSVQRVSCSRCDGDPIAMVTGEATTGFGIRLRAGVDLYLTPRRGLAIEGIAQWLTIGDFTDATSPTSVELVAPRFMLRVSLIAYHDAR